MEERGRLEAQNVPGLNNWDTAIVHRRFGLGSAFVVALTLVGVVTFLAELHPAARTERFLSEHPFVRTNILYIPTPPRGEENAYNSNIGKLLRAVEPHYLVYLGASSLCTFLEKLEMLDRVKDSDTGRLLHSAREVLEQDVVLATIKLYHERASKGGQHELKLFLDRYSTDEDARREGYVLSAETMWSAAIRGDHPSAFGKDAVDAAFARTATEGIPAIQFFLAHYRNNPYAIERGYLGRVLAMQHEVSNADAAQEELKRRKQQSANWDLE